MTTPRRSDRIAKEFASIAEERHPSLARAVAPDVAEESLMPLEAAAKAIFVKANGLPAYWKATGLGPRRDKA